MWACPGMERMFQKPGPCLGKWWCPHSPVAVRIHVGADGWVFNSPLLLFKVIQAASDRLSLFLQSSPSRLSLMLSLSGRRPLLCLLTFVPSVTKAQSRILRYPCLSLSHTGCGFLEGSGTVPLFPVPHEGRSRNPLLRRIKMTAHTLETHRAPL